MNEMLLISCTLNILIQKKSKYNYNKLYYFVIYYLLLLLLPLLLQIDESVKLNNKKININC
jgi:hypothetical protein